MYFQAQLLQRFWHRPVRCVDEIQVWLTGTAADLQDALEQLTGGHGVTDFSVSRIRQVPFSIFQTRFHERITDVDGVVEIEALAIGIPTRTGPDAES